MVCQCHTRFHQFQKKSSTFAEFVGTSNVILSHLGQNCLHLLSPLPLTRPNEGQAVNIHPPCRVSNATPTWIFVVLASIRFSKHLLEIPIPQPHHRWLYGFKNHSVAIKIQLHLLHLHTPHNATDPVHELFFVFIQAMKRCSIVSLFRTSNLNQELTKHEALAI